VPHHDDPQKIELSDAELKGFRESYGFRMDKLRRDQRTREEQRQRLALVKTGVIEMPVLFPCGCTSMYT
jgi:hypothetical protein